MEDKAVYTRFNGNVVKMMLAIFRHVAIVFVLPALHPCGLFVCFVTNPLTSSILHFTEFYIRLITSPNLLVIARHGQAKPATRSTECVTGDSL